MVRVASRKLRPDHPRLAHLRAGDRRPRVGDGPARVEDSGGTPRETGLSRLEMLCWTFDAPGYRRTPGSTWTTGRFVSSRTKSSEAVECFASFGEAPCSSRR